jgi:hypothetical protein
MEETAEIQGDKAISLLREVEYDDGQIEFRKYTVTPASALYHRCKKHFVLNKPGDWNTVVYTWTEGNWVDAEFNKSWLH